MLAPATDGNAGWGATSAVLQAMPASHRSPDGAKRNPGTNDMLAPDFASLHPGYGFNFQTSDTHSRSRGAFRPRLAIKFPYPLDQRAQGMPGADAPRQKVCT